MKRRLNILTSVVSIHVMCVVALSSCSPKVPSRDEVCYSGVMKADIVNGLTFTKVPAMFFTFNQTREGRTITGAIGRFEAVEPEFWISSTPISIPFYEHFMGKGTFPKYAPSFDDMEKFLDKLYSITSVPFIVPSEAMYEAALLYGAIKPDSKQESVVSDGWNSVASPKDVSVSWKAPITGAYTVLRTPYERSAVERFKRRGTNTFYIAVKTANNVPDNFMDLLDFSADVEHGQYDGKPESIDVDGVFYELVPVKGGLLRLGATPEQERWAEEDEKPVRDVIVDDFKIGRTEVTVAFWKAVMGTVPFGNDIRQPETPVVNVSWYDCQEFIYALQVITGKPYRLPSEDEWEFAARGGVKSHGYVFSGGNSYRDYAVCVYTAKSGRNKGESVRPHFTKVASKRPNELGLYDMSGNVWEWVRGWHPSGGAVLRGGSRMSKSAACRVSNRQAMSPMERKDSFGFRIAL